MPAGRLVVRHRSGSLFHPSGRLGSVDRQYKKEGRQVDGGCRRERRKERRADGRMDGRKEVTEKEEAV